MYNWKPKLAEVDPDNPQAWGTCGKCGFITNVNKMAWQYAYQGSMVPQNTRVLTCGRQTCLDPLNPQDQPFILPPDPVPILNARPYPYALEESSPLATQDGSIITTQDGLDLVTPLPNPETAANVTTLYCTIDAPGGSIAVAYLDLFDGNPLTTGRSVLSAITGSSVRVDIASDLALINTNQTAVNPDFISIAAASESQINISYLGLYSASISGALLMSGEVSVSRTIAIDNPVQFAPLGLTINLS